MILESPALVLNIRMQDVLDILESTLEERNWLHFDLVNMKLQYVPYYLFNYDVLLEQKVQDQTFSQGFSGLMAMNAIDGKLEPVLTQIIEQQPVDYERKISHDLKFEVMQPALRGDEAKKTAVLKLAGQFNVGKDNVAVTGFRMVYWPIWKVFVTLPNKKIQRILIDGVAGYPLNIQEVPEREPTWIEITQETFEKLKTPSGWAELSKKAFKVTASVFKGATGKKEKSKAGSASAWLFHSKYGRWTLLAVLILILILVLL